MKGQAHMIGGKSDELCKRCLRLAKSKSQLTIIMILMTSLMIRFRSSRSWSRVPATSSRPTTSPPKTDTSCRLERLKELGPFCQDTIETKILLIPMAKKILPTVCCQCCPSMLLLKVFSPRFLKLNTSEPFQCREVVIFWKCSGLIETFACVPAHLNIITFEGYYFWTPEP